MKGYRGNPYRNFFIMIWIVLAFCLVLSFTGIQDFRIDESDYSKLSEFFEKYPIFKIVVSSVYLSLQYYLVCSAILGRWCKKEIIPISAFGISRSILGVLLPNGVVFSVILMAIDLLVCIAMIFFKADIKRIILVNVPLVVYQAIILLIREIPYVKTYEADNFITGMVLQIDYILYKKNLS